MAEKVTRRTGTASRHMAHLTVRIIIITTAMAIIEIIENGLFSKGSMRFNCTHTRTHARTSATENIFRTKKSKTDLMRERGRRRPGGRNEKVR